MGGPRSSPISPNSCGLSCWEGAWFPFPPPSYSCLLSCPSPSAAQVKFPEPGWLPLHQLRQFQSFFPRHEEVMATEDMEEVELREYFPQPDFSGRRFQSEIYHEDDFEDPLRHNVQCQTS